MLSGDFIQNSKRVECAPVAGETPSKNSVTNIKKQKRIILNCISEIDCENANWV
jgi:hypothetical protein